MRLSSKTQYGLRALFDLAQSAGFGPAQTRDIAARQRIPEAYLNQVMVALRHSGLVRSTRGPQGGHELARPPETISIADVLRALEGPAANAFDLSAEPSLDEVVLHEVWADMTARVNRELARVTLADLVERKRQHTSAITYQI